MICLNILRGLLPKFDPDKGEPPEDHIKRFMMVIRLMGVQHEDVVCRLFPYTFEGKDSMWYFSLRQGSITSWAQFEAAFMHKRDSIISLIEALHPIKTIQALKALHLLLLGLGGRLFISPMTYWWLLSLALSIWRDLTGQYLPYWICVLTWLDFR